MATPTPQVSSLVLGLALNECFTQVQFTITVADFKKKFKNEKGNCTARDLHHTLLEDLVDDIDAINGLPVQCIPTTPEPSSSRGGSKRTVLFLPDEPLEEYTVCVLLDPRPPQQALPVEGGPHSTAA